MFDPDCLDLDQPMTRAVLKFARLWTLLLVVAGSALAFGLGYWMGGW